MTKHGWIAWVAVAGLVGGCSPRVPDPVEVAPSEPSGLVEPPVPRKATGEATLMLMADIRGVLRPCGCTVELQKGGFDRLAPFLARERADHPGAALLHAGPLFFEDASVDPLKQAQREVQSKLVADLVGRVGVDVAGATATDAIAAGGAYGDLLERAKLKVTAANLQLTGKGAVPLTPFEVRRIGGLRVGLFALASPDEVEGAAEDAKITDPVEAARRVVPELGQQADVVVLLSALGLRDTKRLVRAVPGIHFVVAGGLGEHPVVTDEAEDVSGARVMQFHREGRFMGRLTVRMVEGSTDFVDASAPSEAELALLDQRIGQLRDGLAQWEVKQAGDPSRDEGSLKSARHHLASLEAERERLGKLEVKTPQGRSSFSFRMMPLPWDLPQDPEILALMKAFDTELAQINLKHAGTLPEPKPGEAVYVGAETCLGCHTETEAFWKDDRHAHAWATLEKQDKTFDAECVSCHVTGYGKAGGSILGKTAGRENVQCESCHGPGSLHVEEGGDAEHIVRSPTEATCTTCHNKHHSPGFDFDTYKKKLMVPGHGKPAAP